jgi:glutamate-1-semialdehyde 2,1-aminomutase
MFFTGEESVKSYIDVTKCDTKLFSAYFKMSLDSGIYLAPSQYEAGFVSAAHTNDEIEKTVKASYMALKKLKS